MEGRRTYTIGDLALHGAIEFGDGYRTKRSEHAAEGYRIIRVADINDGAVNFDGTDFVSGLFCNAINGKSGQAGDVLLTTKGTVGRVAIVPKLNERIVYSPQLCYFRVIDHEVVDPRYLSYWFRSPEFTHQASDRMNNTDMAAYINLADVRSLSLVVPEILVQRAIAEVLGALDDKIAANTKLIGVAEKLAIALLTDQTPSTNLDDVVVHRTKSIAPTSISDAMVAHFSLPAFDEGVLPIRVSPTEIKSSKFAIERPSVLVSKLNPRFPRIWDVPEVPALPALASTEFLVLEPLYSSTAVLWAMLRQPAFVSSLKEKVGGTSGSHQRVRPSDLLKTLVVDPRGLGKGCSSAITAACGRIHCARVESRTLAATRDVLLPQLMSGKLRVRDAEEVLSAAV